MARDELLAELIREQVLRRTFQELPHAVGVVDRGDRPPRDGELTRIERARVGRDRVAEGDRRRRAAGA